MTKQEAPRSRRKASARKAAARKASARKTTRRKAAAAPPDPTSDQALLARPAAFARPPDIPVEIARRELASLARLARACADDLARVGIGPDTIELATRFARVLDRKQKAWERARAGVALTAAERKLVQQAEALDAELVAGGRWALRRDPAALAVLGRIAEGSGLADTRQDLRDLLDFWQTHAEHLPHTLITQRDLSRAAVLVDRLEPVVHKEADDVAAARAQDLRNRAFWAAHELAQDIREGGRYVYSESPRLAAKFTSRHRSATVRRSRRKKQAEPPAEPSA